MASFTFDIPPPDDSDRQREALFRLAASVQASLRKDAEEERRHAELPREMNISVRVPTELLTQLDHVARDAGLKRSQLIRQVMADFVNYVRANHVRFDGAILRFRSRPSAAEID